MMAMPKIISLFKADTYEQTFPNISILGHKVDFFLECSSYDVILPVTVRSENKLDVFEEAVLKFIDFKCSSVEEMANILCLTPDLINFIIIRLQEMNFIEKNQKDLTNQGKKYIDESVKINNYEEIKFEQIKVFVLKETGEILPFVHQGKLITESIKDLQDSMLTVEYKTIDNVIQVRGKILRDNRCIKKEQMLQHAQIKKALKRYNRIVKENNKFNRIEYNSEWSMDNTASDDIYFHMQAVVQYGNVNEILISDGLVLNIDFVNNYIKSKFSEFILEVKEKATKNIVPYSFSNGVSKNVVNKNSRYYELENLMSRITAFPKLYTLDEEELFNLDQNQMLEVEQKNFLLNCYTAFEWSLFYYILKNPLSSQIREVINNQSSIQNKQTVIQMAHKIGIYKPERYDELFHILDRKRINRMYRDTVPELRVALSIAIITTASNEHCGFRTLVKSQFGMFRVLKSLFSDRGNLSHQTITYAIDRVRNKEVYQLLISCIKNLQPDYKFEKDGTSIDVPHSISQDRLNAEVSLSRKLGAIYFYNLLPEAIKDEWILVSPDKVNYPEIFEYTDILYRIMQDTLYYSLKDIKKNPQLDKRIILEKLKHMGISCKGFDTINERYIRQIGLGENTTLGANAMVYLYYQKDDFIKSLIEKGFIKIVEQLVCFRKHGNNISLSVDIQVLNQIRDSMLIVTKMIGEA